MNPFPSGPACPNPRGAIFFRLPLALLWMLCLLPLNGQKQEVDVVHLINGEAYRGRILDQPDPEIVQLETLCLNTRIFKLGDIRYTDREEINLTTYLYGAKKPPRGYFNRTDLGVLVGSGQNQQNAILSIQMVNGYRFGSRFYPGIGAGIEFYEQAYVPLFADFGLSLTRGRVSPVFRASAGFAVSLEDPPETWGSRTDNRGGPLCGLGLGTSIRTGASSAFVVSLVYRFQSLHYVYTEDWNEDVLNLERRFNRIAIRLGFMFD